MNPAHAPGRLAGKAAVITGGTDGIGLATARLFVREGARLVVVARRDGPGAAVEAELGRDRARFVAGDVADLDTAGRAVETALGSFGRLDVLVNNAAMDLSGMPVLDTPLETARRVFDVNLFGALAMLKRAAAAMGDGGSIVNVTSRTALVGVPGMGVYGASKGALLALTRAAAVELACSGIRVNAVAPGPVDTPLMRAYIDAQADPPAFERGVSASVPQGRIGEPGEVAAAILYLASDESRHVTGTSLAVDGGFTAA